ncbi:MAG TPA: hypothetical protein PK831_00790 [Candidatus Magasanikbacteria bacterium]|nr:hypothetical protein [Candidatus Magasanikbacteria bacterium]
MLRNSKIKKIIITFLLAIFFFVEFVGFTFYPQPVYAQLSVSVTTDMPAQATQIKTTIINSLTSVALGGLVKAVSSFMNKMARDAAMWVASAGKGQSSLIFGDNPAEYFKKTALSASSGVIDDYMNALSKTSGIDPKKIAAIGVSLRNLRNDPSKASSEGEIERLIFALGYETLDFFGYTQNLDENNAVVSGSFLKKVNSGGSMGAFLQFDRGVDKKVENETAGAKAARSGDTGVKPVTSKISGYIKTPASMIQEESKVLTAKNQGELSAQQIAGIYGNATLKTIPAAMMTFLSTLTSELLKNIMTGDWYDEAKKITAPSESSSNSFFSQFIITNKNKALSSFNFLFTVPIRDINEYTTIITELAECGDIRTVNNCVIDEGFMNVLNSAVSGDALTIREALLNDQHRMNKPFISPMRRSQTESKECAKEGYCYYNMQKLRKLRIVPLGFEIAALLADPDNPEEWTLQKVVDGFYDCGKDSNNKPVRDENHPFCHLIDPNWILKVPSLRCEATVFGSTLSLETGNSPVRNTECIDFSTKVSNSAPNYYSYCTQEKNIWNINANECKPQFSTCKKYTNKSNNISATYLSRTLDFGGCDESNVGCRAFSTEYDINSQTWQNSNKVDVDKKILGRPGTIYFNNKINVHSCDERDEGCNSFYLADFSNDENNDSKYFYNYDLEIYLKKAPDYYGCYDKDISTIEIDYPKTKAELNQMTNKPKECDRFSKICIEDEVGCREYSPVDDYSGSPNIPGIIGGNVCDERCVGYETYRQMPTDFAPTEFPLYFIPSEGEQCNSNNVGCDEFTNIDELNKGGESLQYYNHLRRCELPTENNQKTYYSWEGSSDKGYILKVHNLLPVNEETAGYIASLDFGSEDLNIKINQAFGEGSPVYFDDYKEALEKNYGLCNDNVYKQIIDGEIVDEESEGCRALYNKEGQIYYRILDLTVTVSNDCQPLRKTDSLVEIDQYIKGKDQCEFKKGVWENNNECKRCYAGGEYREGLCYYWTIPAESSSCPASANGCRAYKGNKSNNIETIISLNFEEGKDRERDNEEWDSSAKISSEALHVGQHSLEIKKEASYKFGENRLEEGQWYQLSFWARGNTQKLTISLNDNNNRIIGNFTFDKISNSFKEVSVGTEWKYYKLGPIQLDGVKEEMSLVFASSNIDNNIYYIDNLALTKLSDQTYLIKDSWKKNYDGIGITDVPYVCDQNPDDAYPGEALGCRAYKDITTPNLSDNTFYATGFEKLCREDAVGCTAMYDTYNNESEDIEVYNAECRLGASYKDDDLPNTCRVIVKGKSYSCNLANGARKCLINEAITLPANFEFQNCYLVGKEKCIIKAPILGHNKYTVLAISDSTIIIPADTPADSPLFLTYTRDSVCDSEKMGCQKVAEEEKLIENGAKDVFDFPTDRYFLNQPNNYRDTLCSAETYGCNEFTNEDGGIEYFKDPTILGNVLCSYYSSNVSNLQSGWYMDKVGRCKNNNETLCVNNKQCGENDSCDTAKKVPCYENYQDLNGTYGLWSNNSAGYRGFIGQCPEDQKNCVELKDPRDTSQFYPEGKPYYYIFDDKMKGLQNQCQGQVNLVDGCVLFDRTDRPTKLFNSEATYEKSSEYDSSQKTKYKTVLPVTTGNKDTNLILKVKRDRECSEWLYCRTSVDEIDENGKSYKICPDYGVCNQMDENGVCKSEVSDFKFGQQKNDILSIDAYTNRNVEWNDPEYVGYSLLNKKHIGTFSLDQSGDGKEFVLKNIDSDKTTEIKPICKAYPEETSPFDPKLVTNEPEPEVLRDKNNPTISPFIRYKREPFTLYAGANICQTDDCGCDYIKVDYQGGAVTDYWPITKEFTIPPGICTGSGEGVGKPCMSNDDCSLNSQVCSLIETKNSYYGTKGFCLEYDKSRPLSIKSKDLNAYPCLTWLPFDVRTNNTDSYNTRLEAGYYPGLDTTKGNKGEVYCTESTQGYLFSSKNYIHNLVSENFNIISPIIIDNNYNIDNNYPCGYGAHKNCNAKWFYTNLQKMMWEEIGSTATVLFSRIPYHVFKAYEGSDVDSMPEDYANPWDSYWNIFKQGNSDQALEGFENVQEPSEIDKITNYNFLLGEKKSILLDDIRSLYISPVLFKKKNNKLFYGDDDGKNNEYDNDGWNSNDHGFTLFKKLKIDVEGLKNVYENKEKFAEIVKDDFNKYPDFSESNFIYTSNVYGTKLRDAILYPTAADGRGGGGVMHTYSFYGENKGDESIRVGVIIDVSDPKDYYKDENKSWDTPCLVDETLDKDGEGKNSVYNIVKTAIETKNPKVDFIRNQEGKYVVSNFVKNINTEDPIKDKYKEYAIIMFKFDKNNAGNFYSTIVEHSNDLLLGGVFRKFERDHGYAAKFLYGLSMSVTADLKAKCTEFTTVHQDINSVSDSDNKQLNKAWTDKLWIEAQKNKQELVVDQSKTVYNDFFKLYNLDKNGGNAYGVLPDMDSSDLNILEWGSTSIMNNLSIWDKMIKYYFVDPQYQSYPLTCRDPLIKDEKVNFFLKDYVDCFEIQKGRQPIYWFNKDYCNYCDSLLYGEDKGPYKDFVNNYKSNYLNIISAGSSIEFNGETVIKNLFAKAFKVVKRSDGDVYKYEVVENFDEAEKLSKDNNLLAPQIYSLNVERCGQVGSNDCVAYKPNDFTINDVGYNEAACINPGTCEKDPIVGIGSYTAKAKFFVFADTNKMPIKSIKINWGDGKGIYNDGMVGFYPNQKPFCQVQTHCLVEQKDTQLTCKTDTDCANLGTGATCGNTKLGRISFGDSDRACKEGYKTVTYHYTCQSSDPNAKNWDEIQGSLNTLEKAALAAKGYTSSTNAKYCVYKPKIQVKDNWGWCNGSCKSNSTDGNLGCYESECSNSNADSWTTYPGKIIIVAK